MDRIDDVDKSPTNVHNVGVECSMGCYGLIGHGASPVNIHANGDIRVVYQS